MLGNFRSLFHSQNMDEYRRRLAFDRLAPLPIKVSGAYQSGSIASSSVTGCSISRSMDFTSMALKSIGGIGIRLIERLLVSAPTRP